MRLNTCIHNGVHKYERAERKHIGALTSLTDNHRNLYVWAALANILGEKNLVKSLLISTLDKVIYYIGTFLQGSTKPLFTTQNRVETS
jgi:hypothetical protein